MVLALLLANCRDSSDEVAQPSITVKLPPARPYAPEPAFSFGHAPTTPHWRAAFSYRKSGHAVRIADETRPGPSWLGAKFGHI